MKKLILLLMICTSNLFATEANAIKDSTPAYTVFPSHVSVATVSINSYEQLTIVSKKGKYSRVEANGSKVWVESSLIREASKVGGQKISMESSKVQKGLSDLDLIIITDDNTTKSSQLKISRSFVSEMNAPQDKENLERKHTEYIKF